MKLVRYGAIRAPRNPVLMDGSGNLRDLSGHVRRHHRGHAG